MFDPVITVERFAGHRHQVFGPVLEWDTTVNDVGPWIVEVTTVVPFDTGDFTIEFVCAEEPAVLFRRRVWAWKPYSGFSTLLTISPTPLIFGDFIITLNAPAVFTGGWPISPSLNTAALSQNYLWLDVVTYYEIPNLIHGLMTLRRDVTVLANRWTGKLVRHEVFTYNQAYLNFVGQGSSWGATPFDTDLIVAHTETHFRREFSSSTFVGYKGSLDWQLYDPYTSAMLRDDLRVLVDSVVAWPEAGEGKFDNNGADPDNGVLSDTSKQYFQPNPILNEDSVKWYAQPVIFDPVDSMVVKGKLAAPYNSIADTLLADNIPWLSGFFDELNPNFRADFDAGYMVYSVNSATYIPVNPLAEYLSYGPRNGAAIAAKTRIPMLNTKYAKKTRSVVFPYNGDVALGDSLGDVVCVAIPATGNPKYLDVQPDWLIGPHMISIKHDGVC
jgi:hypothetical protein